MANNSSVVSLAKSLRSEEHSASSEQGSLLENIEAVSSIIRVIQTRITYMEAKIQEANATRSNLTQGVLDITNVDCGYKCQLNDLWNEIQNLQLKTAGLKIVFFNNIARMHLSTNRSFHANDQSLSIPGSGTFIADTYSTGNKLGLILDEQNKLCCDQESEELKFVNKKYEAVGLIADIKQKKEEIAEVDKKQLAKLTGKIAKVKIARAIINSLMGNFVFDYEHHPELLAMKEKWRAPIQF